MLSKGQKTFVADVAKNFATVLFGGAFASELVIQLNLWARLAMIAGILVFLVVGIWTSRSNGGT